MKTNQTPPSFNGGQTAQSETPSAPAEAGNENGHGAPEASLMKDRNRSLAQIFPGVGKLTRVSMELSKSLTQTQWQEIGIKLCQFEEAKQWWWGDWWAFSEHKWGERKAIVENKDWQGPAYGTCANNATVSRAFEPSRRREDLSFHHHQQLAALVSAGRLKPEQVDELLDWCEAPLKEGKKRPRSVPDLQQEILRRENREVFDRVIRTLDKRIQRRCKNLSKEKIKAFKDEIIPLLQDYYRECNFAGHTLRPVHLEMRVEKALNDLLGAPGVPLKLTEFIEPIRAWRARSEEELDEIVLLLPIEQAPADHRACRVVVGELQLFISKLEARFDDTVVRQAKRARTDN
jgi:hypothetical protein